MRGFVKYLILIFVIVVSIVVSISYYQYNKNINEIVSSEQKLTDITYKTVTQAYKKNAEMLFVSVINTKEIRDILYKAINTKEEFDRNYYRQLLQRKLSNLYLLLKPYDIKQLHFHLKNNDSFLRLHEPQRYGDNLSDIRKTVVYVNEKHKAISGFEEGRASSGYRFVFPISYNNIHIASVELSISMKAILDAMKQSRKSNFAFIVDKKIVEYKTFKTENKKHIQSNISQNYLYEKDIFSKNVKQIEEVFSKYKKVTKDYEEQLKKGEVFSFITMLDSKDIITTFYPIKNVVTKKTVAYIIDSKSNKKISNVKKYTLFMTLVSLLVVIFIFIGFYRVKSAEEMASEATNVKSMFLTNMSNEIRTPINSIIGFCNILSKTKLDEKQTQHTQHIKSSASLLLDMINDILDFSKIEDKKLNMEYSSFSVSEVSASLEDMCLLLAKKKGVEFEIINNTKYMGNIIGDLLRVNQIIMNLVNNAIKFTNDGSVKLMISTISEDDVSVEYEIKVVDTGVGIEKDAIKKLFNSFEKADININRKYGGAGLGLSITKSLIELMGGAIRVESRLGEGSEFIVNLSFKKDAYLVDEDIYSNKLKDLSTLSVLLVDDNKTDQALIDIMLKEYGIQADIVNDGLEAVEQLKEKTYDLILMDIQMPNMNGYEATKVIRDTESDVLEHYVHIVALSANTTVEYVSLSVEAGMNNHLAKPIDVKKLYNVLVKKLQEKEK